MYRLSIIVASVREKRGGRAVADWITPIAKRHGQFEVDLVDLKDLNLPMVNEPNHPRLQQYQYDHTKAWSAMVKGADAFVFVSPEYNHGTPPALVNALDYLFVEWNYKAVGMVTYGGVSAGTRSFVMTKTIVTSLKMVPLVESVHLPFYAQMMKEGAFEPAESYEKSAVTMLDELARWTGALKTLRP